LLICNPQPSSKLEIIAFNIAGQAAHKISGLLKFGKIMFTFFKEGA
jgi:hypothetical protein